MLVYAVVCAVSEKLFLERGRADAFITEVERDEPETAALLRVEPVEPDSFSVSSN